MKNAVNDVTILLGNYLANSEARERANNIVQAVTLGQPIEHEFIYAMLSPSKINTGISCPLSRRQASYEVAKILVVYQSSSMLAAWVGIQLLGFDETETSYWLSSRGYFQTDKPKPRLMSVI